VQDNQKYFFNARLILIMKIIKLQESQLDAGARMSQYFSTSASS
jgi:hypothetical protein